MRTTKSTPNASTGKAWSITPSRSGIPFGTGTSAWDRHARGFRLPYGGEDERRHVGQRTRERRERASLGEPRPLSRDAGLPPLPRSVAEALRYGARRGAGE